MFFCLGPDEDNEDYEEHLEVLYMRFEKVIAKYGKNPNSELLELSSEITSETAGVYTEIGLKVGDVVDKTYDRECRKRVKRRNMHEGEKSRRF